MKTHMLRTDFFNNPIMQPAEAIRVPRLPGTRRWEQVRIRRMAVMFFYEKFYCFLWEQHCSDGI